MPSEATHGRENISGKFGRKSPTLKLPRSKIIGGGPPIVRAITKMINSYELKILTRPLDIYLIGWIARFCLKQD